MKSLDEALKGTRSEIMREIRERGDLIGQMVGTLYPGILYDEIAQLRHQYYLALDDEMRKAPHA